MMLAFVSAIWTAAILIQIIDRWFVNRWALPVLCAIVITGGLPQTLKPLHANRAGHHAAGCWLAEHAADGDEIVDPFSWAHYYSGAVFREGKKLGSPTSHARFVVLEDSANDHSRLTGIAAARELASRGQPVFRWSDRKSAALGEVVVYRVDPAR